MTFICSKAPTFQGFTVWTVTQLQMSNIRGSKDISSVDS